jgi:hypothetical protein
MPLLLFVRKEPRKNIEPVLHLSEIGHARRVPHPQTLAFYDAERAFSRSVVHKPRSTFVHLPRMVFIALFPRLRHENTLKSEGKLNFRRKIGSRVLW